MRTMAGGNVANTIQDLFAGFGINCGILGACGDDEQGGLFVSNMGSSGVNLLALRIKKGLTAQVSFIFLLYKWTSSLTFSHWNSG